MALIFKTQHFLIQLPTTLIQVGGKWGQAPFLRDIFALWPTLFEATNIFGVFFCSPPTLNRISQCYCCPPVLLCKTDKYTILLLIVCFVGFVGFVGLYSKGEIGQQSNHLKGHLLTDSGK